MSSSIQTHSIAHVRFGAESNKLLSDSHIQKRLAYHMDELLKMRNRGQAFFATNGVQCLFLEPIDTNGLNVWSSAPGPDKFPIYTLIRHDENRFRVSAIKRTPLGAQDRDITLEDIHTLEQLLNRCLPI